MNSKYCYDLEVFPNFFSATFINTADEKDKHVFLVFDTRNDIDKLLQFINSKPTYLIGYNNKRYDDLIINHIYNNSIDFSWGKISDITKNLYELSTKLIKTKDHWRDKDISELTKCKYYKSIDLMKILAFDKLKIGLKQVAVNLKWHLIQDLPIPYDSDVFDSQIKEIVRYNENDVLITKCLYTKLLPEIKLRAEIGSLYKLDLLNCSNSAIGDKLIVDMYSKETGQDYYDFKELRTNRTSIKVADILSPIIKFETIAMKEMFEYIKNYEILIEDKSTKKKKDKTVYKLIFNNKKYSIALGGLHSDNPPKIYSSTDKYEIKTADVASYYPRLVMNLKVCPEHLDKQAFANIASDVTIKRIEEKNKGNKIAADALKIVANSTLYGKLNFDHSFLKDAKCAYTVTMNGQLLLLMLIEKLESNGIECIAANTDGIECKVYDHQLETYNHICDWWMRLTKLDLEFDTYAKLIIRDINNYISITKSGKIKEKGTFVTKRSKMSLVDELRRSFNCPIVAEAIARYYLENIPVKDTITNHKDIYDFCKSQKAGSQFVIEHHYHTNDEYGLAVLKKDKLQKTNRYFVSNSGGTIMKKKENGSYTNIVSGYNITIFNEYYKSDNYNINYNYYIHQANEIINKVKNNQLVMFEDGL